jgi:hypothetical protein
MVDSYDNWASDRRDGRPPRRPEPRLDPRSEPRLEQRLDQWVSAGRQLVDGVAGARPGSRAAGRGSQGLKLDHLGRWVEDKLDWLLEDDDGWRESWEQPGAPAPMQRRSRREPLEAISRRGQRLAAPMEAAPATPQAQVDAAQDWPDDELFAVNRWQRGAPERNDGAPPEGQAPQRPPAPQSSRTLPRSSRRRFD